MGLQTIKNRTSAAAQKAGRDEKSITLIAVSKVQPNPRVRAVLEEGHRVFGENRVQEAAEKWPGFRDEYDGIDLHLLGPLQSNKARQAVQLFDCIHSLDRLK
ncbi:MAG: YggS family pyridoxal phosphate-dependent enzyme, partial [Planktomarina sp.]